MRIFLLISFLVHMFFAIVLMIHTKPMKINIDSGSYLEIFLENNEYQQNKIQEAPKPHMKKMVTLNENNSTIVNSKNKSVGLEKSNIAQPPVNQNQTMEYNNNQSNDFKQDDELLDFLNSNMENQDILSYNSALNNNEKRILSGQIKQCWIANNYIKDKDVSIFVKFNMNEDKTIKNLSVDVFNINNIDEKENIINTVHKIFNDPFCNELMLPDGKFSKWKTFSIKLNLKGFF